MERHPLGMFGLISCACLGDTFVREAMPSPIQAALAGGRDLTRSLSRAAARMVATTTSMGGIDSQRGLDYKRWPCTSTGTRRVAALYRPSRQSRRGLNGFENAKKAAASVVGNAAESSKPKRFRYSYKD